jgi:hypothetical protein
MAKETRVSVIFGNRIAEIACVHGKDPVVRMHDTLSADEAALINVIMESVRCLSTGKSIDRYFNPTADNAKQDELVHMEWDRHGKLLYKGMAEDKFLHASTVQEAVRRRRKFTCFRSLVNKLPVFKDAFIDEEN